MSKEDKSLVLSRWLLEGESRSRRSSSVDSLPPIAVKPATKPVMIKGKNGKLRKVFVGGSSGSSSNSTSTTSGSLPGSFGSKVSSGNRLFTLVVTPQVVQKDQANLKK